MDEVGVQELVQLLSHRPIHRCDLDNGLEVTTKRLPPGLNQFVLSFAERALARERGVSTLDHLGMRPQLQTKGTERGGCASVSVSESKVSKQRNTGSAANITFS